MPEATVNGVRLYYEERGRGTPILGLHGAGSSAVFWEDAAESLSELGRVITYDRRGSWRSERPDPYVTTSVREHADDALALLRALDAEPAILIGRSYGGTVALDLALDSPDSVLGIALLEAGPLGFAPEYDDWFRALATRLEQVVAERGIDAVGEAGLARRLRGVGGAPGDLARGVHGQRVRAPRRDPRRGAPVRRVPTRRDERPRARPDRRGFAGADSTGL
jgi:pimeloyl-ACP methyl ester carboxylesterase